MKDKNFYQIYEIQRLNQNVKITFVLITDGLDN